MAVKKKKKKKNEEWIQDKKTVSKKKSFRVVYRIIVWTCWLPRVLTYHMIRQYDVTTWACVGILGWIASEQDRGFTWECFESRSFYFLLLPLKISTMLFSKLCTLLSVFSHFRFLLLQIINNFHLIMTACFRHNVLVLYSFSLFKICFLLPKVYVYLPLHLKPSPLNPSLQTQRPWLQNAFTSHLRHKLSVGLHSSGSKNSKAKRTWDQ